MTHVVLSQERQDRLRIPTHIAESRVTHRDDAAYVTCTLGLSAATLSRIVSIFFREKLGSVNGRRYIQWGCIGKKFQTRPHQQNLGTNSADPLLSSSAYPTAQNHRPGFSELTIFLCMYLSCHIKGHHSHESWMVRKLRAVVRTPAQCRPILQYQLIKHGVKNSEEAAGLLAD